ncbi:hypothetical protein GCM10010967_09350 [Dyadobacter beijingensis]|uniref:Uncharacterized protein n=1 Tax=Dyadobacter beijingensis TaxID=365489 RepID=A0ABQ2HIT9_9BACT|nr:hypothetical protein [Dyadobacter beijingensis]GGM79722.1 hypothetical protein GCM10010967_09350 [Dyadobacter beijingensis]
MKTRTLKITLALTLLCTLQASVALPETIAAFTSSLLLNGHAISTEAFGQVTRGTISLARDNAGSGGKTLVAFYIYLKRNGRIVDAEAYGHNHAVLRYELSEVLRLAEAGDQLVIDPLGPGNGDDRRVLTIKKTQIVPQFEWFYGMKKKKDNC